VKLSTHLHFLKIALAVALIISGGVLNFAQQPPPGPAPVTVTPTPPPAPATNAAPTTNSVGAAKPPAAADAPLSEDAQLSFQGANVDMVVQWLAKATGKSVVKHPRVQCQLTIVGSKNLKPREAINLVYRALALEGFSAIESSKSILIVPEGSEPKTAPEFLDNDNVPEGRQRLVRIFQLKNVSPNEVKEKIKTALSEKAAVEVVDRANQLIITDNTDNIRLAGDLIRELDVPTASDLTVEFFPIKHGEADDVGSLLGQILNAQVTTQGQTPPLNSGSSSRPRNSSPFMMFGGDMPNPTPSPVGPAAATTSGSPSAAIKIWPDRGANQLIVVAPKDKIEEIKGLLKILDTPKPQDVTIRVLPLRNVNAEDLVREISPLLQRMVGKSARDRMEISANSRSNSLIVLSSQENFNSLEKLIAGLDREEAQEKAVRAFPLQNADAEDVAKQLTDLNTDQSGNRYPYFIFSDGSSNSGGAKKKTTVVADRRRNSIIVQAAPSAMEDIAKLVKTLDEPVSDASLAPKIYRMRFVSAADIADILNELFGKKTTNQRGYWDPWGNYQNDSGDRDGRSSKLSGKVRITSEPYSNSIIVTSTSTENLAAIEEVLKDLDSPSQAGDTTIRIMLNFAKAPALASSLNVLFAKGGSPALRPNANQPQQQDFRPQNQGQNNANTSQNSFGLEQETKEDVYFPWIGGQQEQNFGRPGESNVQRPVSDLIGKVRVVPDRRSNSILLTSNLHFFPQLLKLINDLDAPTPQVLIEARIIEVSSDFRDKLGTRFSPDGSNFTAEDKDGAVRIDTSTAFKNVFVGNAAGTSLRSGVFDSTMNVDVLVQFLRKNANGKVLAEPQISIADNELGKLFVGAQVPVLTGTQTTDVGARNDAYQYRDIGIILEVTPRINNSNEISLRIRTESSSIREGVTSVGNANIFDTRNFRTELVVKDRETIVLGGIIQRESNDVNRKVPGLGSIPGLGWAFRKKDKSSREVELMVFLRPQITRSPEQARELYNEIRGKTPLIRNWQDEGLQTKPPGKDKEKDKPAPPPAS
jgi:general secretion pathway protein D